MQNIVYSLKNYQEVEKHVAKINVRYTHKRIVYCLYFRRLASFWGLHVEYIFTQASLSLSQSPLYLLPGFPPL